jgi:hypothetical protein
MSIVMTFIVEVFRAAIKLAASILTAKDRRTVVLERRAKALRLFKELAAVGLRPRDIKVIERALTDD